MIIVAATFATGAETGECVCLCVGKLLFVWQQKKYENTGDVDMTN